MSWKSDGATYRGSRPADGHPVTVEVWEPGQAPRPLHPAASQRLRLHSPDGFNWGYGGSGPAQLALAILLDFTTRPAVASHFYQAFKFNVVAGWPDVWLIHGREIREWIHRAASEDARAALAVELTAAELTELMVAGEGANHVP